MNIGFISFFSGIGILDLGFEKSGYKNLFVNEIHKPFLDCYTFSRKHMDIDEPIWGYSNISIEKYLNEESKKFREIILGSKKRCELIGFLGGPPCPDFSIGGKNRGHNGDNGRLSEIYQELICKYHPDFFLFENVKGLWNTKKHRQFYEQLKKNIIRNGYILTERLINTIVYGVPQERYRILLFGIKDNHRNSHIDVRNNYISERSFNWLDNTTYEEKVIYKYDWPEIHEFKEDSILKKPSNIVEELTVEYWFRKNDVINHFNQKDCFKPREGLKRFLTISEGDDSKKSFKRLHRWRYSPTAAYGNNEVHLHPYKARRISVSESLAIQSLPKEYKLPEGISLTNKFKAIGNGVPYLASRKIATTIFSFLKKLS